MQVGKVVGRAISTVKHKSFQGVKLLLVQALDGKGQPDGDPVLTVDTLGAGPGMRVLISSDGKGAREGSLGGSPPKGRSRVRQGCSAGGTARGDAPRVCGKRGGCRVQANRCRRG